MNRDPAPPLARFDRLFPDSEPGRLALNAWNLTCVALAALLALYVLATPGFWSSLAGGGAAPGYFLRQVIVNGLPVVFALNLAGFWLYARVARRMRRPWAALALDVAMRAALFVGLHAVIYAGAARAFGSFGGDPAQALGAVGPTLARAAWFGNLSGAYLYSSAVSAYPLFAAAALAVLPHAPPTLRAALRRRPTPWLLAGFALWFPLVALAVSGAAMLLP